MCFCGKEKEKIQTNQKKEAVIRKLTVSGSKYCVWVVIIVRSVVNLMVHFASSLSLLAAILVANINFEIVLIVVGRWYGACVR